MLVETAEQRRARVNAEAMTRAMQAADPDRQAMLSEARSTLNSRLRSAAGLSADGQRPIIEFEKPEAEPPASGQGLDQGVQGTPGQAAPSRAELNQEMNRRMRASIGKGSE